MPLVALFSWPLVTLVLFAKLGSVKGLIWSFLLGYLLLPEAFEIDIPFLPPFDKSNAIVLSCIIGHFFLGRKSISKPQNLSGLRENTYVRHTLTAFLVLAITIPLFTVLTNREPLFYGPRTIRGLGIREYISMVIAQLLLMIPFFIARMYLFDAAAHRELLKAFAICGAAYTLLILFEVRMSPQLHVWTYGYFQHGWNQHIRGGSFRPIVFLSHGLQIGFFLFTVIIACLALWRQNKTNTKWLLLGIWTVGVILVSRNLGAVAIMIPLALIMVFATRRVHMWFAVIAACIILTTPFLRYFDLIPLNQILSVAENISPERAESLRYRLRNEDAIMVRTSEKPLFGWGVWARPRIFNDRGQDTSVIDGHWINIFGESGWLGYLVYFSFLTAPTLLIAFRWRQREVGVETTALMVITGGYLIYVIPNAAAGFFIWLVAGALGGYAQYQAVALSEEQSDEANTQDGTRGLQYSRFSKT